MIGRSNPLNKAQVWLEKTLQYQFQDVDLFKRALTHRSASNKNNERLEFLGDAVLDFIASEIVYKVRPNASEGDLSRLRASLVKDETLAALAIEIGLGEHLILGIGELKTGGNRRDSILADSLEAIFGAVFLDQGFEAAKDLINRAYADRFLKLPNVVDLKDSKTRLQEWLQERKMALPNYELTNVSGKDHEQRFIVTCMVTDRQVSTHGESTTRRKAEQKAAQKMTELLIEQK